MIPKIARKPKCEDKITRVGRENDSLIRLHFKPIITVALQENMSRLGRLRCTREERKFRVEKVKHLGWSFRVEYQTPLSSPLKIWNQMPTFHSTYIAQEKKKKNKKPKSQKIEKQENPNAVAPFR